MYACAGLKTLRNKSMAHSPVCAVILANGSPDEPTKLLINASEGEVLALAS